MSKKIPLPTIQEGPIQLQAVYIPKSGRYMFKFIDLPGTRPQFISKFVSYLTTMATGEPSPYQEHASRALGQIQAWADKYGIELKTGLLSNDP